MRSHLRVPEAGNDQPMGVRRRPRSGVQRSERRRGEAVRARREREKWQSTSAGTRLPSHTPPYRRFSLEAHARRGRGKGDAVAISHGGCGSKIAGPPGDAGKVRPTGPPNKSLSREPRPRGSRKRNPGPNGACLGWSTRPKTPNVFLLALSSCDSQPAEHGERAKEEQETADEIFNPLAPPSLARNTPLVHSAPPKGCVWRRP